MKERFTRKYQDNSIGYGYTFTFLCDICGKPYHSRFTSQEELEQNAGRRMGRRKAHSIALKQASRDARLHFNRCVRCHKWACDKDYDVGTGMCVHCLGKTGK